MPASKVLAPLRQEMRALSWEQEPNFAVLNWIILLDELFLFFAIVSLALPGGDKSTDNAQLSVKALSGALPSQLNAIRALAETGHDFQIRVLARSFSEYADVLTVAVDDKDFALEFFSSSETDEDSNRFWHKHIAKGRFKRRIAQSFDFSAGWVKDFFVATLDYEKDEEKRFSSVSHPSYSAAAISSMSGCGIFFTPNAIFGGVGTSMITPLHYVFNKASLALLWQRDAWVSLIRHLNPEEFHVGSVAARLDYLTDLFFFVQNNDDHPALAQLLG